MPKTRKPDPKGYLYFPGCSLKATGRAYEESMLELFRRLELPLEELDDWNCCGATSYMAVDEGPRFCCRRATCRWPHKAPGNRDLLAPCAACYLVLRKTQDYAQKYPSIKAEVAESLRAVDLPDMNSVKVRHPLEMLYNDIGLEEIKSKVARRWHGGQVACYYGCQVGASLRRGRQPAQSHAHGRDSERGRHSHGRLLAQDQVLRRLAHRHHPRRGHPAELHSVERGRAQRRAGHRDHLSALPVQPRHLPEGDQQGHWTSTSTCPFSTSPRLWAGHWAAISTSSACKRAISGREQVKNWMLTSHEEVESYV